MKSPPGSVLVKTLGVVTPNKLLLRSLTQVNDEFSSLPINFLRFVLDDINAELVIKSS